MVFVLCAVVAEAEHSEYAGGRYIQAHRHFHPADQPMQTASTLAPLQLGRDQAVRQTSTAVVAQIPDYKKVVRVLPLSCASRP